MVERKTHSSEETNYHGKLDQNLQNAPATEPQAAYWARSYCDNLQPNNNIDRMIIAFQTTGAVYERKNFP